MPNFATSDRQPAVRTSLRVLMLLSALMLTLPTFADSTLSEVGEAETEFMAQMPWQQGAIKLDDNELRRVHGKGAAFYMGEPELIPAVILWDESGIKGRSSGTSRTSFRLNVSSATEN